MLFSVEEFLFGRCANTGVAPPFSKISQLKLQKLLSHAGQVKRKVDCGKFSLEFNSVRIVAHKERPALQQGSLHLEKWILPLRGLFSKSPGERHVR